MIYILEAFVFINILISLYICEMHSAFVLYSSVHLFELSWLVCLLALLMLRECMCHGLATQLISSLPVGVRLPSALMALILIFFLASFFYTHPVCYFTYVANVYAVAFLSVVCFLLLALPWILFRDNLGYWMSPRVEYHSFQVSAKILCIFYNFTTTPITYTKHSFIVIILNPVK